jgi:hypothetical protein
MHGQHRRWCWLAALGVFGTGSALARSLVAAVMGGLALTSGWQVLRQSRQEMAVHRAAA